MAWADYLTDRDNWESMANPEAGLPSYCKGAIAARFRFTDDGELLEARAYLPVRDGEAYRPVTVKYNRRSTKVTMGAPGPLPAALSAALGEGA